MDSDQDQVTSEVQQHFVNAMALMKGWVEALGDDPGKALSHLTWLGLAMAQECQRLSENIEEQEGSAVRFFSMDGALFNSRGTVITLDPDYFEILDALAD